MANNTPHMRMSQADRAKQFMPFAALKGLPEALAQKEKILVPRKELSEEYRDELDRRFRQIRYKDIVSIVYYDEEDSGQQLLSQKKITGMVSKIDTTAGYIQIVHTKISFDTITEIALAH